MVEVEAFEFRGRDGDGTGMVGETEGCIRSVNLRRSFLESESVVDWGSWRRDWLLGVIQEALNGERTARVTVCRRCSYELGPNKVGHLRLSRNHHRWPIGDSNSIVEASQVALRRNVRDRYFPGFLIVYWRWYVEVEGRSWLFGVVSWKSMDLVRVKKFPALDLLGGCGLRNDDGVR